MSNQEFTPKSVGAFTLLKYGVGLWLMIVLVTACTSSQHTERELLDTKRTHQIHIDQLQRQVAELEKSIAQLRSEQDTLQASLDAAALSEQQYLDKIDRLERKLAAAQARLDQYKPGTGNTESELREELNQTRDQLEQSQNQVALLQSKLNNTQSELNQLVTSHADKIETLELQLTQTQQALDELIPPDSNASEFLPAGSTDQNFAPVFSASQKPDEFDGTIVKVFYGTNRAVLEVSFIHYVSPFFLPLALLALALFVPTAVKAILRTYLQRVAINLARVALVLGFIYFGFSGMHKSVQRWQADHDLPLQYGPDRLAFDSNSLPYKLGVVEVSIPPNHQKGVVEKENFIYFEFRSDPAKHFVLSDIQEMEESVYFEKLRARVGQSSKRDLFVFVHGFHNTFEDAAFRTAQIAHDSGFLGAPVFYSWPSQGTLAGYTTDENNVSDASQHLTQFLEHIIDQSSAERIHLIAHSMGSRALTSAVRSIALKGDQQVFDEMILAAPDIDAGVFVGIADDLARATSRLTLYASSKDTALTASRKVHGGKYKRAGESFPSPVVVWPVETIDVSNITSGHSYISDSGRILDDLNRILISNRPLNNSNAKRLCLVDSIEQCEDPNNIYWQLYSSK